MRIALTAAHRRARSAPPLSSCDRETFRKAIRRLRPDLSDDDFDRMWREAQAEREARDGAPVH